MKEIQCAVIQDLLPLYYDEVCSEETRTLVEQHIASCATCKSELESLKMPLEMPASELQHRSQDEKMIRKMADSYKKIQKKVLWKAVGLTALIGGGLFSLYACLFLWSSQPVSSENYEISEIYELRNGDIAYRVDFLDEYDVKRVKFELDEHGNFYMTPLRPIVKFKQERPIGDEYGSFFIKENEKYWNNRKIKALYYGAPGDAILIWQEGMALPKASEEMEESYKR